MAQLSLVIPSSEAGDVDEDVRALFDELSRSLGGAERVYSGEYHPALDVFETDAAVEVTIEVAGIPHEALRVLFRSGVLLVVGIKRPGPVAGASHADGQTFHLVEREFGRFARAVRVAGAFDVAHAEARLADGELRIVLPKILDRRGAAHRMPIASGPLPRP